MENTPRLPWSLGFLAIYKYAFTVLAGAGFGLSLLTMDDFFAYVGFALALLAISTGLLQTALIYNKKSARTLVIIQASFAVFSVLFPLAIMALNELFNDNVSEAFKNKREPNDDQRERARKMRVTGAAAFAAGIVVILVMPHILRVYRTWGA